MDPDDAPEELERPKLQSLAQVARSTNFYSARKWMIVVGVIALLGGMLQFFLLQNQLQEIRRAGMGVDDAALMLEYAVTAGNLLLGALFLVFAALVNRYPVPITIAALALFVAFHGIAAIINPVNIFAGILLKIIMIVVLIKAIQAAIAYQKEQALEASRLAMADDYG